MRSWPVRTRLTLLSGALVPLTGGPLLGLAYLWPEHPGWAAAGLGPLTVAGLGLGWLVADRVLRPIRRMTAIARRAGNGSLSERVGQIRPYDEIGELAGSLDAMLERLGHAFDARRQFVADAAREMKRPLARHRTLLEAAMARTGTPPELSQLGAALLEVTDRHEKLVDELLTLTWMEQSVNEPVPVELADIAYRVSDVLEPEARKAGIELRLSAGPARTPGDPALLEQLAQNLLQNAVRYNTTDGWVRVATGTDGNQVRLTVANTGPVVALYDVPTLFEPFRRVSTARSAGLGLSIVRSVARAHGGQVSAEPRDGGGLVVEVTLPRSVN